MTFLLGVIGNPIKQSKSPLMHNKWLRNHGIEGQYYAFSIEPSALQDAVKGMKALHFTGWNVTIPFKESIIPFLDLVDPSAQAVGAVNTVVVKNGQLIGRNTDGLGFVQSLLTKKTVDEIIRSSILIIGAGGAAKGIYYALSEYSPMNLSLTNRTISRAESLIDTVSSKQRGHVVSLEDAGKSLHEYDIVINTTSVGMVPKIDELPIDIMNLRQNALAVDIIYNPLETAFLKGAKLKGADTLNGVGMFVHQGALAFQYWTGAEPDTESAEKMIIKDQGGTTC